MDILIASTLDAFKLLFSGDTEIWEIVAISFRTSTLAIVCAIPPALIIAFVLAYGNFPGRRFLISLFSTFLSVPAVVIGLTLFIILSRQGPMGDLGLLFSQTAMIMGQFLLSLPILVAMSHTSFQASDRRAGDSLPGLPKANDVVPQTGIRTGIVVAPHDFIRFC
jgi:tungstate transport system permease protein